MKPLYNVIVITSSNLNARMPCSVAKEKNRLPMDRKPQWGQRR
jgi:hypothetical protein